MSKAPAGNNKRTVVPKLRFSEFRNTEDWSVKRLGELAHRITEKNHDRRRTRVLTNSAECGVVDQRDYFDKDIANSENVGNYFVIEEGDYVYNPRVSTNAPVGPISRNTLGSGVMSPLYTVFRFNTATNDFFSYYFKSSRWHPYLYTVSNTGARHDRMSVSNHDFMAMPLPYPSPREQQRISDCLSSLDTLIVAHTDKVAALEAHKQGLLQQLFPNDGETVPRRRFPEFRHAGEWQQDTLSSIATIRSGSTPSRAEPKFYENGSIPWVKTTDLNNSFIDNTEELIAPAAKVRVNPVGSVLLAMYGGFNQIGRTGYLSVASATNQAISVINPKSDNIFPLFILYWLNAKVGSWRRIAGSSRKDPNITKSDVERFHIYFPSRDEQEKLIRVLSTINTLITAQAAKIDALKQHKRGLLQQLFPAMDKVS